MKEFQFGGFKFTSADIWDLIKQTKHWLVDSNVVSQNSLVYTVKTLLLICKVSTTLLDEYIIKLNSFKNKINEAVIALLKMSDQRIIDQFEPLLNHYVLMEASTIDVPIFIIGRYFRSRNKFRKEISSMTTNCGTHIYEMVANTDHFFEDKFISFTYQEDVSSIKELNDWFDELITAILLTKNSYDVLYSNIKLLYSNCTKDFEEFYTNYLKRDKSKDIMLMPLYSERALRDNIYIREIKTLGAANYI